jgi:prephenate dehydrogenase
MTVNITILGLGRVGASLGKVLAARDDLKVTGYDAEPETAKAAQRLKALHRAEWNLINAVDSADLVVVAAPLDEQRALLQAIAPELRQGCVVASLGSLLVPPLGWAAEAFPAGSDRHFVAGHAVLNPAHLHTGEAGLEAADAGLFKGGLWALAPAPNCAADALKLVADLARVAEATPYFVDPHEHDGLAAATEGLPTLLSWLAFHAAAASPGWTETRKVADRSFATATVALAEAEFAALRLNRANVLRYLDALLAEAQTVRAWLAQDADDGRALQAALEEAMERRAAWLAQRRKGEWEAAEDAPVDLPRSGELVGRMFVGGLMNRRDKKKGEG